LQREKETQKEFKQNIDKLRNDFFKQSNALLPKSGIKTPVQAPKILSSKP